MNLHSETAEELHAEVDRFLESHPVPAFAGTAFADRVRVLRTWQSELARSGLLGIHWPQAAGGRGGAITDQVVVNRALALAGAPQLPGFVGLDVVGPSIVEHGTDEQRDRLIGPLLTGEEIWCQGFSEPGAGSDLASLKTTATVHDDRFVVRGQKTWTSYAQFSRWCAVLARTQADGPPHKGISYIMVDMQSPGIEIRPVELISGDPEFSEVFFDDVEVPREQLLGDLHGGWGIAMHTLGHERSTYAASRQATLQVQLRELIARARVTRRGRTAALDHPEVALAIARAHVAVDVLGHLTVGSLGRDAHRGGPGSESSIDKRYLSIAEQAIGAATLLALGPASASTADDEQAADLRGDYLYGRAATVYGGTAQIQLSIIAQRLLGLPRGA